MGNAYKINSQTLFQVPKKVIYVQLLYHRLLNKQHAHTLPSCGCETRFKNLFCTQYQKFKKNELGHFCFRVTMDLMSSIFNNTSRARAFYLYLLNKHACDNLSSHTDLIYRTKKVCDRYKLSFLQYMFNRDYASNFKRNISKHVHDGLSDSVRQILLSRDPYDTCI